MAKSKPITDPAINGTLEKRPSAIILVGKSDIIAPSIIGRHLLYNEPLLDVLIVLSDNFTSVDDSRTSVHLHPGHGPGH